jgi:subtilase family serine protease
VAAYDNPNIESDLAAYRNQFGLPSCTTANGCFRKVNQTGGTTYPAGNVGWGQEIALDVDMVSAACPNCKILLVEANSSNFNDLLTAIDYAAANANYISNSWGTDEVSGIATFESRLNKPGKVLTFSTGDNGFGVSYPASSQYVVAVGGTSLHLDSLGNRSSESAWSGAGSGCSAYISKPAWQTDSGCTKRAVADVSAVADPNTGVAVYTSYGSTNGNWWVFGGTSASAPFIAGAYAAAGVPAASTYPASYLYANKASLIDITSGTNGACGIAYLCSAVLGFDGPTGLGVPNGVNAFKAPVVTPPPSTTTTTTAPPSTTTSTTAPATNKAPVVTSKTKSCSTTSSACTFTVFAYDPEAKPLTYAWTASASTIKTATISFANTGTRTITVAVKDGVNITYTSISVYCSYKYVSGWRIICA